MVQCPPPARAQVLNELPLDSHSVASLCHPHCGLLATLGTGNIGGTEAEAAVGMALEALRTHCDAVEASGDPPRHPPARGKAPPPRA